MTASSSVLLCKSSTNPPSPVLRIKHVLVTLCLSEISHELYWDQTQTCAVRSWQLTTWNMAWEKFLGILNYAHFVHLDFNSLFTAIVCCPVQHCVTPHIIVTQLNILAWSMGVQDQICSVRSQSSPQETRKCRDGVWPPLTWCLVKVCWKLSNIIKYYY